MSYPDRIRFRGFFSSTLLLSLAVVMSGCGRSLMSAPGIYRPGSAPLFESVAPELQGNQVPLLYVTDRLPESDETGAATVYGSERSASGALGIADVQIGEKYRDWNATDSGADTGRNPSQPKMKVLATRELVRFPATPYLYRVGERGQIIIEPEVLAELEQATEEARGALAERLALTPRKEVYLFVHGVNTSFDEAVLSAAETWHFLGREGVPIAYTWPAGKGGLFFYTADRESGEYTVLHFKQFLRILADIPEIERIHISAHSRGTDVVTTALRELVIEARAAGIDPREQLRIENLVLVAADLDLEVVMQRIGGEYLGPAFGRLTIYTNAADEALSAAKTLFYSGQRVGSLRWEDLTGKQREFIGRATNLDVVVYEGSGGGPYGHSYYREPAVSSDILSLLRYGWPPGEGQRKNLNQVNNRTWRIPPGSEKQP